MTHTGVPSDATRSRGIGRPLGLLWCTTALLALTAMAMAVFYAPVDPVQGPIQKIFYLHLGAALSTLIAASGILLGSVGYLWQRDPKWDRLADASARVAVVLLLVVILTGSAWAKRVWGFWWEWNPPLTFSLVLWLLYLSYLATRRFVSDPERRASVSATVGLLASLDVPLVYLSVRFLPHSRLSAGEPVPEATHTMAVSIVAVAMLTVCLIWTRGRSTAHAIGGDRSARPARSDRVRPHDGSARFPAVHHH